MDAAIVDLVALGTAATPLADWWEQFCATGHADVAALDFARKQLAGMCELPGRLGQAIRLVVRAPADASPMAFTDAVELLATAARRCPRAGQAERHKRAGGRRAEAGGAKATTQRHRDQNQLALLGFDSVFVAEPHAAPPP